MPETFSPDKLELIQELQRRRSTLTPEKQSLVDKLSRRAGLGEEQKLDSSPKEKWGLKNFDFSGGLIPAAKAVGGAVADNARPLLEGGGAVAGGLLATPGTLGLGTVAGGGLGFAAGRQAANFIDQVRGDRKTGTLVEEAAKVPGDVAEGAAYEMLGPVVGHTIGKVASSWRTLRNFLTGTADVAQMGKAAKKLGERSSAGARFDANAAEAQRVEETTGARFTRGERANDPKAIAYERSQATRGGEFSLQKKEQQVQVNDALRNYFGKNFSQGEVDDFLKFVDQQGAGVQQGVRSAQGEVSAEVARLRPKSTAMDRGKRIQESLQESKSAAKKEVSKLYDEVPNVSVDAEGLASTVKNLRDIGHSLIPNYEREHTISPIVTELGEKFGKMRGQQEGAVDLGPDLWDSIVDEGGILAKS